MLPFSYAVSTSLREELRHIQSLRIKILTTPLSPALEHTLMWTATVDRIQASLAMAHIKIHRKDIEQNSTPLISGYRQALQTINDSWIASPNPVTVQAVNSLAHTVYNGPLATHRHAFLPVQKSIRQLLTYLENQTEHPVIHAGIALGIMSASILPPGHPGLVSRLLACIFLAKEGFDVRGLAAFEYQWALETDSFDKALTTIKTQQNLNHWLLFFAQSVGATYTKLIAKIAASESAREPKLTLLTQRQQAILHLLEDPARSITNRAIQKHFRISQITASRELARLTTIGLLVSHGRGRSVSYTGI